MHLPVLRVSADAFADIAQARTLRIGDTSLDADGTTIPLDPVSDGSLELSPQDKAMLEGAEGEAVAVAMRILCAMAVNQGASRLVDVSRGHIDGCIYASPANLTFAERMADMGARVRIPTTMNAISVDHAGWRAQGVPPSFGGPAQRLADAYVRMGCQPTFTCAPYLLDEVPEQDEVIAWSESNAVIYANSVLARGRRSTRIFWICSPRSRAGRRCRVCIWTIKGRRGGSSTLTCPRDRRCLLANGRIPCWQGGAGPYSRAARSGGGPAVAREPEGAVRGVRHHVGGADAACGRRHTRGPSRCPGRGPRAHDRRRHGRGMAAAECRPEVIDLVAVGSPHASLEECRRLAEAMGGRRVAVPTIVTAGRAVMEQARQEGTLGRLTASGFRFCRTCAGVRSRNRSFRPAPAR